MRWCGFGEMIVVGAVRLLLLLLCRAVLLREQAYCQEWVSWNDMRLYEQGVVVGWELLFDVVRGKGKKKTGRRGC